MVSISKVNCHNIISQQVKIPLLLNRTFLALKQNKKKKKVIKVTFFASEKSSFEDGARKKMGQLLLNGNFTGNLRMLQQHLTRFSTDQKCIYKYIA